MLEGAHSEEQPGKEKSNASACQQKFSQLDDTTADYPASLPYTGRPLALRQLSHAHAAAACQVRQHCPHACSTCSHHPLTWRRLLPHARQLSCVCIMQINPHGCGIMPPLVPPRNSNLELVQPLLFIPGLSGAHQPGRPFCLLPLHLKEHVVASITPSTLRTPADSGWHLLSGSSPTQAFTSQMLLHLLAQNAGEGRLIRPLSGDLGQVDPNFLLHCKLILHFLHNTYKLQVHP